MRISVVIPAYNRETLIRDAIESALNQSEKIDEIIVIDNDSSDDTFRVAQTYADTHGQVRVYRNEKNVGMISNWNRGIEKATGDYVSVLHSDDIIPRRWCEIVKRTIEQNEYKDIGLYFGIYACFEEKNGKRRVISRIKNFPRDTFLRAEESLERLWKNFYGNPNCSASIIYKKSIFDAVGYFDPERGTEADQHFHIRVLSVCNSYFIAEELLYYRRHEFQAFDFKKEVESADTVVKRLLNAIRIQKESLHLRLVQYTYCGVLLYAVKFLLTGTFRHAFQLFSLPGIFNWRTLLNFPRFFFMLLYRKYVGAISRFLQGFGVTLGFLLFCLVVLRHAIWGEYDSIGHNWDWGFPALPYMFERISDLSTYAWNSAGLGRNLNLQAHFVVNELLSLLGSVFIVKTAIIITFLAIFLVSFLSFKKLLDFLLEKKDALNFLPSLLYAFSPFLLSEIIGGSWYMWVSYALAPLSFFHLIKYVWFGRKVNFFGYLIFASLVIISLQNFVTLELIGVLFLGASVFIVGLKKGSIKDQIRRYLWAHVFLILMNLYWIVPFLDSLGVFYALITASAFTGNFEGIRNITQSIFHIFLMTGYLDRNMAFYAVPFYLLVPFVVSIILFWIGSFLVFFLRSVGTVEYRKKDVLVWLAILASFILIVKGGNAPFESLTMQVFQNFPLMSLYRSPQHLMFAIAFIVPVLVSLVFSYYLLRGIRRKTVFLLGATLVFFWTSAWWYGGDLGSRILREKSKDHIDFYTVAPELKKVYDANEKNNLIHRILFLPTTFSPQFVENEYQKKAQGGQSEYIHLRNPTFNWEFNDIAKRIDDKFCYQEDFNFLNYLSLTNTRYIYLREDVYPHHSECGIFKVWDIRTVKDAVSALSGLVPIAEINNFYKVDDGYFFQHIFIPERITVSDKEPEQLPEVVSGTYQLGTGIFFKKQNPEKGEVFWEALKLYVKSSESLEGLEFKRVDPTRYRVSVKNVQEPFPLILSEGFHQGWMIYSAKISDSQSLEHKGFVSRSIHGSIQNDNMISGKPWDNWFRKPFSGESSHLLANGYANSWFVDPKEFCSASPESCELKENGTYDIVLVLEFWPQRLMYFGAISSILLLLLYIGIVWSFSVIRKRGSRTSGKTSDQKNQ